MPRIAAGLLVLAVVLGLWRSVRPGARRLGLAHGAAGAGGLVLAGWSLAIGAEGGSPPGTIVWEGVALGGAALALGLALWRLRARLGASGGMVVLLHAVFGATGVVLFIGWAIG